MPLSARNSEVAIALEAVPGTLTAWPQPRSGRRPGRWREPRGAGAPGASSCEDAGAITFQFPIVAVGADNVPAGVTVTVTAQADPNNVITECKETNNTYTQTFTIPAPG